MTQHDFKNKKAEMLELSNKLFKSEKEKQRMVELANDVGLYEANNGLVDENGFLKE